MRIKRGADMGIKRGADMRIKRGADMGIKRGWVVFLCELSLNLFRKHVMVLDKTEFADMFQLIKWVGELCRPAISIFLIVYIDSIDSKPFTSVRTLC